MILTDWLRRINVGEAIAKAFDLATLNPAVWLNFQLAALNGFAQQDKTDEAVALLQEFTHVLTATKCH